MKIRWCTMSRLNDLDAEWESNRLSKLSDEVEILKADFLALKDWVSIQMIQQTSPVNQETSTSKTGNVNSGSRSKSAKYESSYRKSSKRYYWRESDLVDGTVVYFLLCEEAKSVKIGVTQNIKQRISSLQTGCPYKLVLMGFTVGGYEAESEIHQYFKDDGIWTGLGEWFYFAGTLFYYIERVTGKPYIHPSIVIDEDSDEVQLTKLDFPVERIKPMHTKRLPEVAGWVDRHFLELPPSKEIKLLRGA